MQPGAVGGEGGKHSPGLAPLDHGPALQGDEAWPSPLGWRGRGVTQPKSSTTGENLEMGEDCSITNTLNLLNYLFGLSISLCTAVVL